MNRLVAETALMSAESTSKYDIPGVELLDDRYTVVQSLIRNRYKAMDEEGSVVLRGKQKMLKMKEEFPFTDGEGNDLFTVKAGGILDIAGNYAILTPDGEPVVSLDNDYSILQDTWTVRDGETEAALAEINSRGALTTIARNVLPFGHLIPHRYEITDASGNHVGSIAGKFSLKDRYVITIDDASDVPREPIVAAAMVIDAIQGN